MKGSAHVLLDEGSGKIWTCFCWEKGNFLMINEFKYGQTWKIWPSPLSLWLYSTCNSLKIKNWFSYKNPNDSKFFLVYKFICASCSSSYIGKACHHFKTRIVEHIKTGNKSHISKHLHSITTCSDSYNSLCFKMIYTANSKFNSKIKEALHINWRKPNLNAQQSHLALTLSL